MKHIKNIIILFILLVSYSIGEAQVKYKLQLLNDGVTYEVSIVPETSYRPPLNVTSTAQITVKVPTGSFEVANLKNIQPNVEWEANSIASAPEESETFDYISFGLATNGTEWLRYEEGIEIPVFTFENAIACNGEVSLMDNSSDPFMPPNSASKNVGNQITIAGANGNAYVGNMLKSVIPCGQLSTDVEEIEKADIDFAMFPNPASNDLTISVSIQENIEVELSIFNLIGKRILTKTIDIQQGENIIPLDISHLPQGSYLLEMRNENWKLNAGQFVKLEK